MSLSREDWTVIRDAWNRQSEEEAVERARDRTAQEQIRREVARLFYLLVHLDDTEALKVAEMKEEAFIAFCMEQLA